MYLSAFALDSNDKVVEAKASAMEFADALAQLFANIDQATALDDDQDAPEDT